MRTLTPRSKVVAGFALATLVGLLPAVGMPAPAGASPADRPAAAPMTADGTCYPSYSQHSSSGGFAAEGVYIRTGTGDNCTRVGLGYSSHAVTYYCWSRGDDYVYNGAVYSPMTWTYLRDDSTGVVGWVPDLFLRDNGSHYSC